MIKKIFLITLIYCLSGLFLFSCAKEKEATEPIRLGVVGAHSGDMARYGVPSVNAAKLVVEKINAKGGVLGRNVELIVEDDACKSDIAKNIATDLVLNNVHAVLGHTCSEATRAALSIYKDSNIICMSPSANNPMLTRSGDYPNFFRTIAPHDSQASLGVDFALKKLKVKKIAVLHDQKDYGKGLAEYAKQFLEESDKANVVLYEGITPNAMDYTAAARTIKESGAQAVIFGGYYPEAAKIVVHMRKKNMDIPFISDDAVRNDQFIKAAGEYAEGVYATGLKDISENPLAIEAIEEHKKVYGKDPGAFFLEAYSATLALLNAIEKADTAEYESVVKALREEPVDTPHGKIKFDEQGDAVGIGFAMYKVKNGVYVEIK